MRFSGVNPGVHAKGVKMSDNPDWISAEEPREDRACPECGTHMTGNYHRVFSVDTETELLCADCESRTDRYGTREAIGASLENIGFTGDVDLPTIEVELPGLPLARYRGAACCRYCQEEFHESHFRHFVEDHVTKDLKIIERRLSELERAERALESFKS